MAANDQSLLLGEYSVLRKLKRQPIVILKLKLHFIAGIYSADGTAADFCYVDQDIFVKPAWQQAACYAPADFLLI
jgi:hypothetical protein